MLKTASNIVLGSKKSSTISEGTPPVSSRLRPCWAAILSIPPHSIYERDSNVKVFLNTDIPLACITEDRDHIFPWSKLLGHFLRGEYVGP